MITDCHIHIQPMEMFKPHALELMKKKRPNFEQITEFCRSPKGFPEISGRLRHRSRGAHQLRCARK